VSVSCWEPVQLFNCTGGELESDSSNTNSIASESAKKEKKRKKKKKKRKKKKKKEKKRKDKMWQGVKLEIPCASNTHNLDFKSR